MKTYSVFPIWTTIWLGNDWYEAQSEEFRWVEQPSGEVLIKLMLNMDHRDKNLIANLPTLNYVSRYVSCSYVTQSELNEHGYEGYKRTQSIGVRARGLLISRTVLVGVRRGLEMAHAERVQNWTNLNGQKSSKLLKYQDFNTILWNQTQILLFKSRL